MEFRVICRLAVLCICSLLALPIGAEDDLWEWVTPSPQGHDLFAAAVGNGVTVAVGRNGTAITSTDGIKWRTSHTGAEYLLTDVVWGNGLFVAVGGEVGFEFSPGLGVVLTSDDGFNWIECHREDYLALEAVVWAGSRFVAVGIGDRALLSSDGLNWLEVQLEASEFMWDLAWNGSQLVAIGRDGYFSGPPSYFTSENGEEWQQFPFGRDYAPASIAASGGRFVAVGSENDALVSDDGLSWIASPYESSTELRGIVDGGDRFLATGNDVVGMSPDGFVWSIEEQPTESRVYGLAPGGGGYLAVGEDGFMMSSPEGSEWTQLSAKSFDFSASWEIIELATNGSTIVGVGDGGLVINGRHGTEWVRRYSPTTSGHLSGLIWTGTAFWTAGSYGIMRSNDGVLWAQVLLDHNLDLFDIAWNGSLFVGVGRHLVVTSPDGHDWSYKHIDIIGNLFTVGWTGSEFVAAGSGSIYLTSTDGEDWHRHLQAEDVTLWDMASNGDRLVAVGERDEVGGLIYSTSDGVQWTETVFPEIPRSTFRDVTWTGTHFVAVARTGGQSVFTSTDGISWSSETTGTGVWPVSVVGDERSLLVTGRGLQIIRRTTPLADPEPPRRSGRRVLPVGDKVRVVPSVQE